MVEANSVSSPLSQDEQLTLESPLIELLWISLLWFSTIAIC